MDKYITTIERLNSHVLTVETHYKNCNKTESINIYINSVISTRDRLTKRLTDLCGKCGKRIFDGKIGIYIHTIDDIVVCDNCCRCEKNIVNTPWNIEFQCHDVYFCFCNR